MSSPFLWRVLQTNRLGSRLSFYRENEHHFQIIWKRFAKMYSFGIGGTLPSFQVTQSIDKNIKIYGVWGIEIVFIIKCSP